MKYTHIVNAYYVKGGKGDESSKPLDKNNPNVVTAGFMAYDLTKNDTYVFFKSMNAWGQEVNSTIHKSNINSIEVIK